MLFPTITFAVFFLVVYAANWLLMPRLRLWKWFIIAVSYVFYGWWDWRFVLLLVAATFVNQALGVQIARARGRRGGGRAAKSWLALSVVVNLAALGYFKYIDFFAANLDHLLSSVGLGAPLPLLRILLPVGISFLVFRVLTYTIDIYRGELAPASTLDFGVYVAFFPYLLAGPIARARDFLPQLRSPRDPRGVDAGRAFMLILGGLAKKMLIADYLSTHIVNGVFASPQSFSSWETLWGIAAYSVQIYCDFSAYSDIAIGISLLLGFELPENFNAPYTARTIQDFWRRWHITLSSWLRDYLYIPLGGNRKGRGRTYVNLIVTFLLAACGTAPAGRSCSGAVCTAWAWRLSAPVPTRAGRGVCPSRARRPGRGRSSASPCSPSSAWPGCSFAPTRSAAPSRSSGGCRRAGQHRLGGHLADRRPRRARHRYPVRPAPPDRAPRERSATHRLGRTRRRSRARPVPHRHARPAGRGRVPLLQVLMRPPRQDD